MAKQDNIKRKGRLPKAESDAKRKEGKRMYVRSSSLELIAEVLEVHIDTIKSWKRADRWEKSKSLYSISLAGLKEEALNTYALLKEGKDPKLTPDKIAKLASAFDKLSNKRKLLTYAIESYELLTDELVKIVGDAKSKKAKEKALNDLKYMRAVTDKIINNLYKEVLDD